MNDTTIICLANNYFFDPTSKHHVMRELARTNHVLWINWHASRRPALNRRDFSSILEKLAQFRRGLVKVQERLWVLTPLVVPLPSSALARKLNRWLVGLQTRWILRKLPSRRQVWSFTADVGPLLGGFGEKSWSSTTAWMSSPPSRVTTSRRPVAWTANSARQPTW